MPDKRIYLQLVIILFFIFPKFGFAMDKEIGKVVFYDGVKLYGKLRDNSDFEVSLFLEPYKKDGSKCTSKFWGFDRDKPTYVINELSVIIGGSKTIIPKETINDLTDVILPMGLYLVQTSSATILYIRGGDGVSSYKAALKFVDNRLVSRTIEFKNPEGELDSVTTNY